MLNTTAARRNCPGLSSNTRRSRGEAPRRNIAAGRPDCVSSEQVRNERENVTDAFHPYQQWLGFPAGRLPRDYYELFRLERFEPDLKLIAREADIVIAEVRRVRPGPFASQWAALLDELCTAKACLTDPRRKAAYDARLRSDVSQPGLLTETGLRSPSASSSDPSQPPPKTPDRLLGDARSVEASPITTAASPRPMATPDRPPARDADDHAISNHADPSPAASTSVGLQVNWLDILYRASALGLVVAAVILAGVLINRRDAVRGYLQKLAAFRNATAASGSSSEPVTPSQAASGALAPTTANSTADRNSTANLIAATNATVATSGDSPATNSPTGNAPIDAPSGDSATASSVGERLPSPVVGAASASFASSTQEVSAPGNAQNATSGTAENASEASELPPEFRTAAQAVWQAMAARDLLKAREELNALAAQVRHPRQRDCVAALESLLLHLEEFWRGLTEATASLRSTEEIPIGETMVIVVEANRERIVVRAAGQNRAYGVREMPTVLIRAIVEQRFQKGPDTQVLLGAFLAVDPKGDPGEATRLWQAAQRSGTDVALLMQALAYAPEGKAAPSAPRLPIPSDGGELSQARQWIESRFPTAYTGTASIPVKADAAQKMLATARDAALNDEAVRYALLREVVRLAVESGEAKLAWQAVEDLAARYAVDVSQERRTVAEGLSQSRVPESLHQRIASELLEAAQAALTAGDREAAQAAASGAVISARKARNAGLLRQALAMLQRAGGNP